VRPVIWSLEIIPKFSVIVWSLFPHRNQETLHPLSIGIMSTLRHSCHSSAARGKPLTDLLGQTAHLHKYGDLYCGSRFQSLSLQEGLVFLPKNVSFSWCISLLCDQNVENILQSKNILNLNLNFGNRIYASHFLYSHQYSENYSSFSSLETSMFCDTEKWYLMCSSSMICHWFFSFQSLTFLTIYTLHKKKEW
jgi:hypothetical protein